MNKKVEAFENILQHGEYKLVDNRYIYIGLSKKHAENLQDSLRLLEADYEKDDGEVFDDRFEQVFCTDTFSEWFISDFNTFFKGVVLPACTNTESKSFSAQNFYFNDTERDVVENAYSILRSWYHFLHHISNHSTGNNGLNKISFWITSSTYDNSVKSHVVEFNSDQLDFSDFKHIDETPPILDEKDHHLGEKVYILRRCVSKHFDDKKEILLKSLIESKNLITSTYQSEFENYVSKFGLDKSLDEITEQRLKLISSITTSALDVKSKFLAAPAVLLASILLRTNDNDVSFLSLVIILGVTFLILKSMAETAEKSISLAQDAAFRLLDNIKGENDHETKSIIKVRIINEKAELQDIVNNITKSISYWTSGTLIVFVAWIIIQALVSK